MTDQTTVGTCQRCGMPCRVAGPGRKDAKMLRYAKQPKGYCASCAVHDWLRNTYPVNVQLAQAGPKILLHDGIRKMFADIMRQAKADMNPDEINWNRIVEYWDLPFAEKVKPTNTNPCTQAELDEIAAGKRKGFRYIRREASPLEGVDAITSWDQLNQLDPGLGDELREALGVEGTEDGCHIEITGAGDEPPAPEQESLSFETREPQEVNPMGRKKSEAVEEKRKPVKVRLIDRKHAGKVVEVYRLMEELVADHHADRVDGVLRNLDQAKIALAWREGWKPDVDGVVKLAQIRKATDADKYLFGGEWDYVIELNAEAWPRLSADRQRQVMDHELYHAAPDLDRHGKQKINAREALCWRMRKHYFQEHREIVERYGAEACFGLNDAAKKAVEEADRPLLAAIEQSGNGKPSDWRKAGVEFLSSNNRKIKEAHCEKLRDAGMPTLGELARRMDDEPGVWALGLRFADSTRQAIEDALGAVRAAAEPQKPKAA